MSNTEDNKDQSMEEILQSIKRIIAEDDDSDKPAKAAAVKEVVKENVTGSEVLELHDLVEEGKVSEPEIKVVSEPSHDVLQSIDEELSKKPDPIVEQPMQVEQDENRDVLAGIDSLLTSETVKASSTALMNLKSQTQKPPVTEPKVQQEGLNIAFRSGATLEELVVEALTPELKAWLNAHLPAIVERMVAAEIKKITGN